MCEEELGRILGTCYWPPEGNVDCLLLLLIRCPLSFDPVPSRSCSRVLQLFNWYWSRTSKLLCNILHATTNRIMIHMLYSLCIGILHFLNAKKYDINRVNTKHCVHVKPKEKSILQYTNRFDPVRTRGGDHRFDLEMLKEHNEK